MSQTDGSNPTAKISRPAGLPIQTGTTSLWMLGLILVVLAGLSAIWSLSPLARFASAEAVLQWVATFGGNQAAPSYFLAAFLVAGLLGFPVTLFVVAGGMLFGPLWGYVYAFSGSFVIATLFFVAGRAFGRNLIIKRLPGHRVHRISFAVGQRGLLAMFLVSLLPVAPFNVTYVAAGASHVSFSKFMLGTPAGLAPGMIPFVLFGNGLLYVGRESSAVGLVTALVLLILGVTFLGYLWLRRRRRTM